MLAAVSVADHWDSVYRNKADDDLSWMRTDASRSLRLIGSPTNSDAAIVDVGAGTSTLVDHLVDDQWPHITLLDLSAAALEATCCRLADRCADVELVTGTILDWQPQRPYDVWHDRAVFHFLHGSEREWYVSTAAQAIRPGGRLVLATFAHDGPESCSGLPTQRYDTIGLSQVFGDHFALTHHEREVHVTPWAAEQPFTWAVLERRQVSRP
jgi:2-polyprenyl-3-methyl-5-hydroxy-6-metoxy-1,4-benzoquinol methylase